MSLRKKILLLMGGIAVVLIGFLYLVSRSIVLDGFAKVEEQATQENVGRALAALNDDVAQLSTTASDYSSWDDTYSFIQDGNQAYITTNFQDENLGRLRLDLVLLIDSTGKPVFGKGYAPDSDQSKPVAEDVLKQISADSFLTRQLDTTSVISGVVPLPQGIALVAARPILQSDATGPVKGTLIFGRWLDAKEVARLATVTHLSLLTQRLDDKQIPAELQTVRSALSEKNPILIRPLNEQAIAGYTAIKDVTGQTAALFSIETPRPIYQQGQASVQTLVALTAAAIVIFTTVMLGLLTRLILTPLTRLTRIAGRVARGETDLQAADTNRSDEVGVLARAFQTTVNSMHQIADAAAHLAQGDLTVEIKARSETDGVSHAMIKMKDSLRALMSEVNLLVDATVAGKLATRADASQHQGEYHRIVQGINHTLDAVIGPLNIAAEYVDRISKGDIPGKITDPYNGDFNEIKNNLNTCIDHLNAVVNQTTQMYEAQVAGDIEACIETGQFSGAYRQMVQGVNASVRLHVNNTLKILGILSSYADGDFRPQLEKLPGKQIIANEKMDTLRSHLRNVIAEVETLSQAAVEGQFAIRADTTKFKGDWAVLVKGVNDTLDMVVDKVFWYEQLLDAIPFPISVTDLDLHWTFINKPVEKMLNPPRKR